MVSKKRNHPIRNGIIATVVGGTILAQIPGLQKLGLSFLKILGGLPNIIWSHLTNKIEISWGVLWVLIGFSLITIINIIKSFFKNKSSKPKISEYKKDIIQGVSWKWGSYPNNFLGDLAGFCSYCHTRLVYNNDYFQHETIFYCERCNKEQLKIEGDYDNALGLITRQIERKINSGEWINSLKNYTILIATPKGSSAWLRRVAGNRGEFAI